MRFSEYLEMLDEGITIKDPKKHALLKTRLKELKKAKRLGIEDKELGRKVKGADIASIESDMGKLTLIDVKDLKPVDPKKMVKSVKDVTPKNPRRPKKPRDPNKEA